ncbi:hypothetical protein ACN4EG_27700 [Alkalinema pantanalense CENA528]|uniref:hypothetical protein n=1 Tax=Alkalinema pantanalense TaxID=1620705 RepID=UPI003D6F95F0
MAAQHPLTGVTLIDCARSNAKSGIETAAMQCGYGDQIAAFTTALKEACDSAGITFNDLNDLTKEKTTSQTIPGIS